MPLVIEDAYESIPRVLYLIGAHHPESERPALIPMKAVGEICYFAFTSFERAEFFAESLKKEVPLELVPELVPVRMEPRDFAKLHRYGHCVKQVAINPRLQDCHRSVDMIDVAQLASFAQG
jgi:hypothetical protein